VAFEYKLFSSTHTFKTLFVIPIDTPPHACQPPCSHSSTLHSTSNLRTCNPKSPSVTPHIWLLRYMQICYQTELQIFSYYLTHLSRFLATQDMAYHCILLQRVDEKLA